MVDKTSQQERIQSASETIMVEKPPSPLPIGRILTYVFLSLGTILALLPFVWMFNWSFMSNFEVSIGQFTPTRLMPANIAEAAQTATEEGNTSFNIFTDYVFRNYLEAWERGRLGQYMWNSARITAIQIAGLLLTCVPAAYAFARMRFAGKNVIFSIMLTTLMIPGVVTLIPNYLTVIWFSRLSETVFGPAGQWLNNWPALTVPFMASAFTVFLLRQFFQQIPQDLWDAAQIDGASHMDFLLRVVVPLSRAPIMTVVTLAFIGSWNALLWPLLVVQTDEWRPIAFGLERFVNADATNDQQLQMAAAVLTILPILVLYFFTQKQFTEGLWTGSVK